jgi:Transposase DDE domain group 1
VAHDNVPSSAFELRKRGEDPVGAQADPWGSIRAAKDTGLRNLPLHGYAQNQIWCEIAAMACELLAWMAMLALTGPTRRWEPKRLRLCLFSVAGRIVRGGRRLRLRLAATWPWARQTAAAITRLQALAPG